MNLQMITAANTLHQLQKRVDLISNNVANVNTVGYKRSEATFQDLLTQTMKNQPHAEKEVGRITPYGLRVGHGARLGQTTMRYEQGSVQETGRPLDFMITGEGTWFRTARNWVDETGNERREEYVTRNGSFHLQPANNEEGAPLRLVTNTGLPVLNSEGEEVIFPGNMSRIETDEAGTIRAFDDSTGESVGAQLGLIQVNRADLLEGIGDGQFRIAGNMADLIANGAIKQINLENINEPTTKAFAVRQGALEMSNVDLTQEMAELMVTQRLMQFQSRSISIADDMMGLANSIRG
jgi:flagellar basal-body rod protein FlgG